MFSSLEVVFLALAIVSFLFAVFEVKGPWIPIGLIFMCLFLWP